MAAVNVIGLLQNGNDAKRVGAPTDARRTLTVRIGETYTLRMSVLDASGSPVDLTDGTLVWTCRKHPTDVVAAWTVTGALVPSEAVNRVDFALAAGATRLLEAGLYYHDVWLTLDDARDSVLPMSSLFLEPVVGRV